MAQYSFKLPRLNRLAGEGSNDLPSNGDFREKKVKFGSPQRKNSALKDNPFRMPTDEEVFIMQDEERKKKLAEREKIQTMGVSDKTTSSFRHSSTRLHVLDDMAARALEVPESDVKVHNPGRTRSAPHTRVEMHKEKENLKQFVEKKREMFLLQYSLNVKRDEVKKLDEMAQEREDALKKAEKMLEEDAARFDAFLKENNIKTMEATKRADAETKAKLDKVQEIKRLNAQIGVVKNEMAKYDEQLEDCKKYKEFLDKLTPPEWFEEIKQKMGDIEITEASEEIPMYFTKSQQLLDIFKALEESNMFLIQNNQETERVLEELLQRRKETEERMGTDTENLKSQIAMLEAAIEREETKWQELDGRAYKNFGPTDQESMLMSLHEKVSEVYSMVVGDSESNLGTIAMLTAIEHRMEELFRQRDALPSAYLTSAEKTKEKERRMRHRQEKMEKQKEAQDLRIKRALERSQAPAKKKEGKPVMFRSVLPTTLKEKRQQEDDDKKNKEEEELRYFGLLP